MTMMESSNELQEHRLRAENERLRTDCDHFAAVAGFLGAHVGAIHDALGLSQEAETPTVVALIDRLRAAAGAVAAVDPIIGDMTYGLAAGGNDDDDLACYLGRLKTAVRAGQLAESTT